MSGSRTADELAADLRQRRELRELLRRGGVIAEMHGAGCRPGTGCTCLVLAIDPAGAPRVFRGRALDLLEPDYPCVCSEYR